MKTILIVSPTGTLDNGAEISIFYLMTALVKRGHTVINVAPGYQGETRKRYKEKFEKAGITTYILSAGKWWWEDAPGGLPATDKIRAFYYRENIAEIQKLIQEKFVDLVITNTVNMFQGAVAAASESVPHFWLIHEFPDNEFSYYLNKIDFISENSDKIYSVAGLLNQRLNQLFKTEIIHQFIPYSEMDLTPLKKGETPRFVSVGRITERKNQLELLKAYHRSEQTNIELLLIGDQDEEYGIECIKYIKKYNLKNVKIMGYLENPWEEVTDKDIFVSSSAMETFGLVYIEALLKGLPTIISDNPGYKSVYETFQEGQMYHLGSLEALSKSMTENIESFTILKQESVRKISEVREKYSLNSAYKKLIEDVESDIFFKPKTIRHLGNLTSLNLDTANSIEVKVKRAVKKIWSIIKK
ncbi:MAG: glycosyltransferase family 4 protein [Streptococcaceae bacterium]|nr:glycosyltransferase family 4 protein [Streptococcaceae bacterium]